jgi:hypothetical protein
LYLVADGLATLIARVLKKAKAVVAHKRQFGAMITATTPVWLR